MIEKLWLRLSEIANGPPIVGLTAEDIQRKDEWLALASACGLQLASELKLENVTVTARRENVQLSGSVDVVGNIVAETLDKELVKSPLKVRMIFDDPYVSVLRWRNGQASEPGFACFSIRVEPFGVQYSPRYIDMAKSHWATTRYIGHDMYYNFWPLYQGLDIETLSYSDIKQGAK